MRIFSKATGQVAKPIKGRNDSVAVYKCSPPSNNRDEYCVKFEKIEHAAAFLLRNPTFGIRMQNPNGIIYDKIVIEGALDHEDLLAAKVL